MCFNALIKIGVVLFFFFFSKQLSILNIASLSYYKETIMLKFFSV